MPTKVQAISFSSRIDCSDSEKMYYFIYFVSSNVSLFLGSKLNILYRENTMKWTIMHSALWGEDLAAE